jgi:hypothetical protein
VEAAEMNDGAAISMGYLKQDKHAILIFQVDKPCSTFTLAVVSDDVQLKEIWILLDEDPESKRSLDE